MTSANSAPTTARNGSRLRASRSCGTCRAVKRRCDQKLPRCGQCVRQRDRCGGYRDEWDLVFRDQTKHTIKRTREKKGDCATKDLPPPIRRMSPSEEDVGVNFFLRHFIEGGRPCSRGCLNYIPSAYYAESMHPTILASMAAIGLITLANSTKQSQLARKAHAKYAEAICKVNAALASPIESVKDSTLMSVISLSVFEGVSQYRSWPVHVQGAAALVVARGKGQFSSPVAVHLFNQVRTDLIASTVNNESLYPEAMLELEQEASKHVDTSSPFWLVGVLGARCARLLSKIRKTEKASWPRLLDESTVLRRDFEALREILAAHEPYRKVGDVDGDPSIVYNRSFDIYKDDWAIRVWNNWRNLLMIACRIEAAILSEIIDSGLALSRQHMEQRLKGTMQTLSDLGHEILATVPQALGFIVSVSEPRLGLSPHDSVTGGYMLASRLDVVGQSPATDSNTRRWIIQHLRNIDRNMGISASRQIIEHLEEMG